MTPVLCQLVALNTALKGSEGWRMADAGLPHVDVASGSFSILLPMAGGAVTADVGLGCILLGSEGCGVSEAVDKGGGAPY